VGRRAAGPGPGLGRSRLIAEALRPGTFHSIVAIEPIVFSPQLAEMVAAAGGVGNTLADGARRRRAVFASRCGVRCAPSSAAPLAPDRVGHVGGRRDEARASFATKALFRTWDPRALDAYVVWGQRPMSVGAAGRASSRAAWDRHTACASASMDQASRSSARPHTKRCASVSVHMRMQGRSDAGADGSTRLRGPRRRRYMTA
jgi:hypothetical protein